MDIEDIFALSATCKTMYNEWTRRGFVLFGMEERIRIRFGWSFDNPFNQTRQRMAEALQSNSICTSGCGMESERMMPKVLFPYGRCTICMGKRQFCFLEQKRWLFVPSRFYGVLRAYVMKEYPGYDIPNRFFQEEVDLTRRESIVTEYGWTFYYVPDIRQVIKDAIVAAKPWLIEKEKEKIENGLLQIEVLKQQILRIGQEIEASKKSLNNLLLYFPLWYTRQIVNFLIH